MIYKLNVCGMGKLIFSVNDKLRHKVMQDWGVGKILDVTPAGNLRVFFVNAGEKIFKPDLDLLEKVSEPHPVLDNPNFANIDVKKKQGSPQKPSKTLTVHELEILTEFSNRLLVDWLPAYCNDSKRNYSIDGYKPGSNMVSALDASDFMRALDHKIVTDMGGGRYRMPQSKATEVIFWEGSKTTNPRAITLWLEPIITFATIARLHLDYGWPIDCLGTQSEKYEFDFMAFNPQNLKDEYIAGEVKKSSKELDELLANMTANYNGAIPDFSADSSGKKKNAYNKLLGLHRCHAPFFWAVGPDGDSRLFEVFYSAEGNISLNKATDAHLYYSQE